MIEKLAELHKIVFGDKGWGADEIMALKKSGAEVLGNENAMIIYRAAADEAEILTIAVHPDRRREGLASALIALMEKELKNAKKIFLEVSVENTAATQLYKSLGFSETAKRPGYYQGVDAILMAKEIHSNKERII
ncbi:MAG: GNAT family N-acetyltransferase [Rickettsiales bacterium]|nr:GNAT family N-acetyltransferase [Rickettsiales bacterium]